MPRGVKVPSLPVCAVLVLALVHESSRIKDGPLRWLHWCWAPAFWKAWNVPAPLCWCLMRWFWWEARCRDALVWVCGSHLRPEAQRAGSVQCPSGAGLCREGREAARSSRHGTAYRCFAKWPIELYPHYTHIWEKVLFLFQRHLKCIYTTVRGFTTQILECHPNQISTVHL